MLVRLDMVNLLAAMVARSAARVKAEIAADLGYGYAEPPRVGSKRPASSVEHSVPPSTVVDPKPVGLGSQVEVASIQEAESGEKKKWGMRLQQICQRAGTAAAINDPAKCAGLQPAEAARLKALAFEAGGFRTIRQNVRNWEMFEEWAVAHNLRVYPPTIVAVMRYAVHLSDQGCGPAVLPSFKYAVSWICKRLAMSCPEMGDARFKALIDKVHADRGKELKEAVPLPPKLIVALDVFLARMIFENKKAAAVMIWWVLILIYASLRFDDGIHVAPTSCRCQTTSCWASSGRRKLIARGEAPGSQCQLVLFQARSGWRWAVRSSSQWWRIVTISSVSSRTRRSSTLHQLHTPEGSPGLSASCCMAWWKLAPSRSSRSTSSTA